MEEPLSIYFRYSSGRSDKDYNIFLVQEGDGWIISYEFGRHGQTLNKGRRIQTPVAYAKAKEVYDKMIKERVSKGYVLTESGTPYQDTDKAGQVSGLAPQLLNEIDEEEIDRLIEDPDWIMQEKKDGTRMMAQISVDGIIKCINRKGLIVPRSGTIVSELGTLTDDRAMELDGECIGNTYHIFDILKLGAQNLRDLPCLERLSKLYSDLPDTNDFDYIKIVESFITPASKRRNYDRLKKEGAEGVVFKRRDAPYIAGRPNSGGSQVKFKFWSSATLVVSKVNDKRSVALSARDQGNAGLTGLISVGNVTIPPNKEIPRPGQLCEIRYLYAYKGGSLYQPTYLGVREDKDEADFYACLKFKVPVKQRMTLDEA